MTEVIAFVAGYIISGLYWIWRARVFIRNNYDPTFMKK